MTEYKQGGKDEMDLLRLFSNIGQGIKKLVKSFVDFILFLIVFGLWRIHWILLFSAAGVTIGYLFYQNTERVFSSEMIVQPNGFTSIDMAQYINDLHHMCERNNSEGIASAFQIPEEIAKKIKNIEAFHFIDVNQDGIGDYVDYKNKYNPRDTTNKIVLYRILIRTEVFSNDIFLEVDSGLIRYINNNPYLIQVNQIRKNELQNMIEQADKEISILDSLQNFEYYRSSDESKVSREGQIVIMNEKETQLYYLDKVSLLTRRLQNQSALELSTEPITIIKGFSELQAEENPKSRYFIRNGILFGFLGYLLLMFLQYRKKIINYLSSKR